MSEPYYSEGGITIYHGDAREILPSVEADVLVTDPPYGVAYVSNASRHGSTPPIAGDHNVDLRDWIMAAWGDHPSIVFGSWRAPRPKCRTLLVWDKGDSPGMGDLTLPWGPSHEEIYIRGAGWVAERRRGGVLRHPTLSAGDSRRPDHPTPKPVPLMVDLLRTCQSTWVIFDPFMGSGPTLRAAKDLGRRAVGIEIEERYCEIAARRLGQEVMDFGGLAA
jgi:site-specific DNA-methyltransferase (adenine-specific)